MYIGVINAHLYLWKTKPHTGLIFIQPQLQECDYLGSSLHLAVIDEVSDKVKSIEPKCFQNNHKASVNFKRIQQTANAALKTRLYYLHITALQNNQMEMDLAVLWLH